MTEDFCSFEISKLLKEKGFDEDCLMYYMENRKHIRDLVDEEWPKRLRNSKAKEDVITVPTHQMALKWLREINNIHITISLASDCRYKYEVYKLHSNYPTELKLSEESEEYYLFYQEATEAAIQYCLEHLLPKSE